MYTVESLLTQDDIAEAKEVYERTQRDYVWQYYNLFNCERRDVMEDLSDKNFYKKLCRRAGDLLNNSYPYFVLYPEGSFCRQHSDHDTDMTIVTYIETKDLVGGDAIVMTNYEAFLEDGRPHDWKAVRSGPESDAPPYGQLIVPETPVVQDGQSLVYGPSLRHSVSKVYRGHRLVLITWFNKSGEIDKSDMPEEMKRSTSR